jgi:hypothetical protein
VADDAFGPDQGPDQLGAEGQGLTDSGAASSVSGLNSADVALILSAEIEPGISLLQCMRLMVAILGGESTTSSGVTTFFRRDGSTTAITVIHDINGNRTASTIGNV